MLAADIMIVGCGVVLIASEFGKRNIVFTIGSVVASCGFGLFYTIMLFNHPKLLVAPCFRDDPGLLSPRTWRKNRRHTRRR
jgi:hypothetical protein